MDVRLPDGTIISNVPDGTTKADLVARLQRNGMAVPAEWLQQDAPKKDGSKNNDLSSQLGLYVRAGLKGALALPAMGADAIGGVANKAQDLVLGDGRGVRFQQTLPTIDNLLTQAGIPEPDTPLQRVVSKGVEMGTGAGAAAKAADAISSGVKAVPELLSKTGIPGWVERVVSASKSPDVAARLAANPATQIAAGTGSGVAGQQSAEAGGGDFSQFVSSVLGGLAGAGATGGVKSAANALAKRNAPQLQPVEIERRITAALQRQGIDPESITPAMMAALRKDAEQAMKLPGTLNEAALARLADYRRLGLTPTRGRMTLDPYDVTQEQNAMRVAAATGARDAKLPEIAQANNQSLLGAVEDLRPVRDRVALGERVMTPIMARDASMQANVNNLYAQARDTSGRSLPLEGGTFTRMANEALDQENVGSFLPPDIARKMNDIATGKYPLTVDVAEQLKTSIGNLQRNSNDGNTRTALGIVRKALDNTPLQNDRLWNPGNVPAVPGMVPPSTAAAGRESVDAFNAARAAARQRFAWQEGTPAVQRTLEGAAPDNFIQREILSRSAAAADVARLAAEVSTAPGATEAIRSGIVQHLKDAAIGKGNEAQTANFSGRQWLSALSEIGDAKLRSFFSAAEIEQLKAIGRVGSIETFQPRGSAVNNSNTAAGVAGLLQGLSRNLGPLINKVPGGQALVSPAMDNLTLSFTERGLTNVPRGLMTPPPRQGGLLDPLVIPGIIGGGLLASP